jgi:hypothetical protein
VVGIGAAASSAAGITPALPGGYTAVADDIWVTFHECDSSDTLTPPTGWALITSQPVTSGTTTKLSAIWHRAIGGDTAPTIADAGNHQVGRMIVVRGCITAGNPWDIATPSQELAADATVSIPSINTSVADCLILAAFSTGQDIASTAGATGWANASLASVTERMDDWTALGTGGGFSMMTGGKAAVGATGASTATLSLTPNFKAMLHIALKPAAATPSLLIPARARRGALLDL